MISLEAYRERIGVFIIRGGRSQNLTKGSGFEEVDATLYFLRNFGICIIILVLTLNLNFAVLKLLKLLVDGDVESNPGPTTFNPLKVVQGSFHQGNPKFGNTAGIQCTCNSLFAICWSVIKRVTLWTTSDLDYILENGDSMYKSLNTDNILNVDDLPHNISVEGYMLTVTMLQNETGAISTNNQFDLLERSYKENNTGNRLIFFISGYTFSLIWSKSAFFLCNTHSRDEKGYITSNGTSVLLKFKSLHDVQNYITEVYLVQQNTQSTFCEIQYVHVETENDISLILNSF